MAKKKSNKDKKQPWSIPLRAREELYNGINPSAGFGIGSFLSQGVGYLGGFRTGQGMNEDEARWAAYLGLPYDKEYAPDTKIRFEHDKDYPDRQYQGVSKRAKNEIREEVIPEAKRIKDEYGKEWIQVLDERGIFGNDSTIYHPRETYTGDLGKFGIREVGNSGIYEIGDKYDFPSWVPVPDRNKGTELMIRDTIWSDRANPKLYNKEIIKRKNKHSIGGLLGKLGSWYQSATEGLFKHKDPTAGGLTKFGQFAQGFGINSNNIGGIANFGATAIGGLLAGKNKTGVGSAMQTIGSLASNIPGVEGLNLAGGLINAAFGSNINEEFVNQTEQAARQQSNYVSGATDTTSLLSDWNALTFLGDVKKSDVGSDGWFSDKASDETDRLNKLNEEANMRALASISNTAENIDKQNDLMLMANYSAYGGPIDMKYTGVMSPFGNQFKDGGIFIKPSKRGTFTAAAKKRGMGVQEFASKVLANKEDYSSAMVKKANFARNASKWKHADGGPLEGENSSNYNKDNNKRTYIGGTTSEARKKYLNWDKELTQIATNLAASYGISPSLVIDRLSHEGLVDQLIRKNNYYLSYNGDPNYPSDAFDMSQYNAPYGLLGLDNIFDTYTKGVTKTKRPINMIRQVNRNERGELVNSAETKNLYDTLELFVAELASRRNQVKKQYPNLTDEELDSATSARYNASNKYFKQLMDSGKYKTKYPIDVKGINIPAPTKIDSKYIQDQVQSINKSNVLEDFKNYLYYVNSLVDESIFTVGNKSYNPALFMDEENYEFTSDSPLVDRFIDNYVNRNFTIPSKVKVIDDYYYEDDGKDMMYLNKKSDGGNLFTNGVTTIGNGGTHEQSPLEGVPMGVDNQGIPNLVEEGEVIFNDYVFSNRLRVPKEVRQKYKLTGVTFADAAKQLQKESEERPNDPISKNGLNAVMTMLQQEQEAIRMKKESNKYAKGGKLGRVYDGTGGDPNWLYKPITQGFIPSKDDILAEMEAMYSSLLGESTLPIASKIEGSTAFKDRLGIKGEEQSSKVAPMKTHPLRYVPLGINFAAVANDLLGGNEPDYSNANMFARAIEGTNRPIRARQIGNYLTYRPFDSNYYINTLNANTAAARRAAVNTSGGNRAAALTGILAADYNYGNQLGALARQAEEYNLAQRQAVEQFNRGTNVTNAEMAMKADLANAEQAMQRARMYGSLAEYRDKILAANRAEKSANLTNFIQGLGNLGTELTDKDKLRWLADLGVLKYDDEGKYTGKKSNESANGGRITRKKRGGFTI